MISPSRRNRLYILYKIVNIWHETFKRTMAVKNKYRYAPKSAIKKRNELLNTHAKQSLRELKKSNNNKKSVKNTMIYINKLYVTERLILGYFKPVYTTRDYRSPIFNLT